MSLFGKVIMDNAYVTGRILRAYARVACRKEQLIQTHLTRQEKALLMQLALKRSGRVYVEVGSYVGASACFISRGIRLTGKEPGTRLYCVDTWMNDAMTEGHRDTYHEFTLNTLPYRDLIVPLRGKSEKVAALITEKVDFLFIDGDHSYQGVAADIHAWFPKLASGALVVFHDYGWAEGVQRAVAEFVRPLEAQAGQALDNTYWAVLR